MAAKLKSLQLWCKRQCEGYRDVEITNLTSSWKSGLAFCAIIHRYRPDLIDYDSLSKENVYENNKLAFDVAKEHLDIPALLDPEDMVAMAVPDKLCIVTYLSQYYNTFSKMEPVGGPGIKQCRVPPKRAPSSDAPSAGPEAKKITPTKQLLSDQNGFVKKVTPGALQNTQKVAAPTRTGTYGDTCSICHQKVYLMERHIEDGQLYHRRCLRDKQKSVRSPTRPKQDSATFQWPGVDDGQRKHERESGVDKRPAREGFVPGWLKAAADQKTSAVLSDSQNCGPASTISSTSHKADTSVKQSQNSPSSPVVKTFFGAASPQPASAGLQNKPSHKGTTAPANNSGSTRISEKTMKPSSVVGVRTNEKLPSIMERAAMFDTDKKPQFGMSSCERRAPSSGVKKAAVSLAGTQTADMGGGGPRVNTVTYTYHTGVASDEVNAGTSQTDSSRNVRSDLLQSLANIRRQKNTASGSSNAFSAKPQRAGPETDSADGKSVKPNFLGDRSALVNDGHQDKEDGVHPSQGRTLVEGMGSQSADNKRSILKMSSPRPSLSSSGQKESVPKAILKPRPNDNTTNTGTEEQPKPILKSRKSSDESELEPGLLNTPRPILKTSSPTEPGQTMSSSPPKSILKSRETSPESGCKPTKSILKSKDSTDEMEVDEGNTASEPKPRSILKHCHDGSPQAKDEPVTSPIRSILKHAALRPESRSTPKGSVSPEMQKSDDTGNVTGEDKLIGSLASVDNETKFGAPVHSSRAQLKLGGGSVTPQPAPRKHINHEDKTSSDVKPHRPNQPPSVDENHSTAMTSTIHEQQPWPKDGSTPRSILKTSRDRGRTEPNVLQPRQEKKIPESIKSTGTPSLSSSVTTSQSANKNTQHKSGATVNNFSAFNLNDSLAIRNGTGNKTTASNHHTAMKSAWQMEMEARKKIHKREGPMVAPPRPAALPAAGEKSPGQATSNMTNANGDFLNAVAMRAMADEGDGHRSVLSAEANQQTDLNRSKQLSSATERASRESGKQENSSPPPRPPPPVLHGGFTSSHHEPNTTAQRTPNADVRHSPTNAKANLSRCPAFRIPDSPHSSPESVGNETHSPGAYSSGNMYTPSTSSKDTRLDMNSQSNKRKIMPDTRFSFRSGDFGNLVVDSPTPSPSPDGTYTNQQHSPPKRRVNAETRVATLKIMKDLESLDKALQVLEKEGRALEEKIRSVSDDEMDENNLMVEWFEMISRKNELVRKESELMYKKRQQELEDLHMDLEYELRLLMSKPDNEKTASDRIRENALIQELLDTVNQRNHIVDSMEEDRKRYIAEDQEIADMMAKTGLLGSGAGKKKKNDKRKHEKNNRNKHQR